MLVPLTRWSGALPLMVGVMIYMFGQTLVQPNAVAAALEPLKHMAGMGAALIGVDPDAASARSPAMPSTRSITARRCRWASAMLIGGAGCSAVLYLVAAAAPPAPV